MEKSNNNLIERYVCDVLVARKDGGHERKNCAPIVRHAAEGAKMP
ncbi:MAG: hypothetical protein R2912_06680 [Eubacteriales bacterium]